MTIGDLILQNNRNLLFANNLMRYESPTGIDWPTESISLRADFWRIGMDLHTVHVRMEQFEFSNATMEKFASDFYAMTGTTWRMGGLASLSHGAAPYGGTVWREML